MRKKFFLTGLLSAYMALASAKGDITVTTSQKTIAPGETVDVIVSMTNEEDEVRGLTCEFTLPVGLTVVENSFKQNEDRLEDMDVKPQLNNGGSLSKITISSYSGDIVYETEGELFRFTIKADANLTETKEFSIKMNTVVSYDDKTIAPDKEECSTSFKAEVAEVSDAPYEISAIQNLELGEEEQEIFISLANTKDAGGVQLYVTLPEGMDFVKNKNGKKVEWSYTNRVASGKKVGTNLDGQEVSLMLTNEGGTLIQAGDGAIVSFKVKGSMNLALNSEIRIHDISVSDTDGKDHEQSEIIISVHNKALADAQAAETARQEANTEAYNADLELIETLKGELSTAVAGIKEEYLDTDAKDEIAATLNGLSTDAQAALDAVKEEGNYESVVNAAGIRASIEALKQKAADKEAQEEADRLAQIEEAYDNDIEKQGKLQLNYDLLQIDLEDYTGYFDKKENLLLKSDISNAKSQIEKAYKTAKTTGTYNSPLKEEELQTRIDNLLKDAKKAKNVAEAQAQVAADKKTAKELQASFNTAFEGIDAEYLGEDYNELKAEVENLSTAIDEALENVSDEKSYTTPFVAEELSKKISSVSKTAKDAQDAAIAEANRVAANEAAHNADKKAIAELQDALNAAKDEIEANYADYADAEAAAAVQAQIDALTKAANDAYAAVEGAGKYENIAIDADAIKAAASKLVADAKKAKEDADAESQRIAANEAAHNADLTAIAELQGALNAAKDEIEANYADYADAEAAAAVQAQIDALTEAANDAYAAVEEAGEYQHITIDADAIKAAASKLVADAKQAKEDADAESQRTKANDAAYNADIDAINALQSALDAATTEIKAKYDGYADEDATEDVQDKIDVLYGKATKAYKNVQKEGTYTRVAENTESIAASIQQLVDDAAAKKAAADAAQAEAARVAANQEAYQEDVDAIASMQTALNEANTTISNNYAEFADAEAAKAVQDMIDELSQKANAEKARVEKEGNYASQVNNEGEIRAAINKLVQDAAGHFAGTKKLTDGETYDNPYDLDVEKVTYTREFKKADTYQALYLPFDMENGEWCEDFDIYRINTIFEVDTDDDGEIDDNGTYLNVIKVKATDKVKHNTPYIVKLKAGKETGAKTITVENTTIYAAESNSIDCSTVSTKYEFTGIYSRTTLSEVTDLACFAINANTGMFAPAGKTATLGSFRWYLTMEDRNGNTDAPANIRIVVSEDEVTAINDINAAIENSKSGIYTINGMEVNDMLKPGIYIKNGKKIIVK